MKTNNKTVALEKHSDRIDEIIENLLQRCRVEVPNYPDSEDETEEEED